MFIQCFITFIAFCGEKSSGIKILQFGSDESVSSPLSYASLVNHSPKNPEFPEQFTVCYRSKTASVRKQDLVTDVVEIPSDNGGVWLGISVNMNSTLRTPYIYGQLNKLGLSCTKLKFDFTWFQLV